MKLYLEIAATVLTVVLVASTSVPDSDDEQSVTVGASWLQRRTDVVDEVVHSLNDDYDEQTTSNATTPNTTYTDNVSMQC